MDARLSMLISFVLGIVPTFGLLWAITARYESKVAEKDTMTSFIIGIFGGILVSVSHIYVSFYFGIGGMVLVYAVLLALAEVMLYFIYLNMKRFRGRTDMPFIALGFSLGVTASYIGFLFGHLFRQDDVNWDEVLGMALFAFAASTMRASIGMMVARGLGKKLPVKQLLIGTALLGVFDLLSLIFFYEFLWTFAVPCIVLGLVSFALLFPDLKKVRKWTVTE